MFFPSQNLTQCENCRASGHLRSARMRQYPKLAAPASHSHPNSARNSPCRTLNLEIRSLKSRGFLSTTGDEPRQITCEIFDTSELFNGWASAHPSSTCVESSLDLRCARWPTSCQSPWNPSALGARLLTHLQNRRGDDGEQENVEEDRADARGHEGGDEASDGGRGRGGGADDESDA